MPKVTLRSPTMYDRYKASIMEGMVLTGVKDLKQLSKLTRINYSTLLLRMSQPEGFRFSEMKEIKRVLGVFPEG